MEGLQILYNLKIVISIYDDKTRKAVFENVAK